MNGSDTDKRVIGLDGEMRLAMELHKRGWQVYRAYIDDKFDFVILKSHCEVCKTFKNAWTREQVWDKDTHDINYYIFKTEDVERFDDLELDTYQVTDNQKTELPINKAGEIVKKGRKYDYSSFKEFLNNFDCLEKLIPGDSWK